MDSTIIKALLKDKKRLVAIVAVLVFLMLVVRSCSMGRRQKRLINQEISQRMDLEKKIIDLEKERQNLENSLLIYQQELQDIKEELESTKAALSQEQMINSSLKKELNKVNRLKSTLEEDLQEIPPEGTEDKEKMN